MNDSNEKPLASFCLKSYNHRKYLDEALKGAFAQTYRPLEIVISDDGSTDGSWEYIQQAVAEFKKEHIDVPVVVNRNSPNLGNLGNWQKCCELAHGELLIKADGDDISLPERTGDAVNAWVADGRRAMIVSQAYSVIDVDGNVLGGRSAPSASHPMGAAQSWSKACYENFDRVLKVPMAVDDYPYGWRARILGDEEGLRIEKPAVMYRVGSGMSTAVYGETRCLAAKDAKYTIQAYPQVLADMHARGGTVDPALERALTDEQNRMQLILGLCEGDMVTRWKSFRRFHALYKVAPYTPLYFHHVCYLLPPLLGDALLSVYLILNYYRKRLLH